MTHTVRERPVVLLVESRRTAPAGLAGRLDAAGYTVWQAETGADARQMLAEARRSRRAPDLIVLDKVLPDVDGLVLSAIVRADTQAPIVVCAGHSVSSIDRALGYHIGVDAFVASPPGPDELETLLQSLLRRVPTREPEAAPELNPDPDLQIGSLLVHEQKRSATIDSQPLGLTPTQYRVLSILAKQPEGLVSTADIAQSVWSCEPDDGVASLIATQIARIRAKLRDRSCLTPSIVSVPGRGYRLLAA